MAAKKKRIPTKRSVEEPVPEAIFKSIALMERIDPCDCADVSRFRAYYSDYAPPDATLNIVIDAIFLNVMRGCGIAIQDDWVIPDSAPLTFFPDVMYFRFCVKAALKLFFSTLPEKLAADVEKELLSAYCGLNIDTLRRLARAHHPPTMHTPWKSPQPDPSWLR